MPVARRGAKRAEVGAPNAYRGSARATRDGAPRHPPAMRPLRHRTSARRSGGTRSRRRRRRTAPCRLDREARGSTPPAIACIAPSGRPSRATLPPVRAPPRTAGRPEGVDPCVGREPPQARRGHDERAHPGRLSDDAVESDGLVAGRTLERPESGRGLGPEPAGAETSSSQAHARPRRCRERGRGEDEALSVPGGDGGRAHRSRESTHDRRGVRLRPGRPAGFPRPRAREGARGRGNSPGTAPRAPKLCYRDGTDEIEFVGDFDHHMALDAEMVEHEGLPPASSAAVPENRNVTATGGGSPCRAAARTVAASTSDESRPPENATQHGVRLPRPRARPREPEADAP